MSTIETAESEEQAHNGGDGDYDEDEEKNALPEDEDEPYYDSVPLDDPAGEFLERSPFPWFKINSFFPVFFCRSSI